MIEFSKLNKCVLIDTHPYNYDTYKILKQFNICHNFTKIFKRCYSKNIKYTDNTIPFPFVSIGGDVKKLSPIYTLMFNRCISNNKKNKIFWAGRLFTHHEDKYNIHVDRQKIMDNIKMKLSNEMIITGGLGYKIFLQQMSKHKYILDLKGCSELNKRFYEGLSVGSLCLFENQTIVWPFEENDQWNEECSFSTADELYTKYTTIESDSKIYNKLLLNQNRLVKKYFNKNYIKAYILKFI